MKTYAIWQDKKVIGYIDLTEEQRDRLNSIHGIGIYIGFDFKTNPEKYCNRDNEVECTEKDCDNCPIYFMGCNKEEFEKWKSRRQ